MSSFKRPGSHSYQALRKLGCFTKKVTCRLRENFCRACRNVRRWLAPQSHLKGRAERQLVRFPSTFSRPRRTVQATETPAQSVRAFNSPLSPGSLVPIFLAPKHVERKEITCALRTRPN